MISGYLATQLLDCSRDVWRLDAGRRCFGRRFFGRVTCAVCEVPKRLSIIGHLMWTVVDQAAGDSAKVSDFPATMQEGLENHRLNGIAMTLTGHAPRAFDLNVGTGLDHWTAEFALREIIANALDEQALTGTQDPEISQDDQVIGQFGMGLKDAPALFDRFGVTAEIKSKYGDIQLARKPKASFDDVVTWVA